MVKIKSLEDIAAKFVKVTPERAPFYEAEVTGAGPDWLTGSKAGQGAYDTAMARAEVRARREKKLTDVAANKFVIKASKLGPERFRAGVEAAKEFFKTGFSDAHAVISGWVKPTKGPRGDAKNYDIVKSIGDALHKKRVVS